MELGAFINRWFGQQGGAERANYQMFLTEFCQSLDLPLPDPKGQGLGTYEFEAPVKSQAVLGTKGTGRIDLYKKDCFILEAKQSQLKPGEAPPPEPEADALEAVTDLFGNVIGHTTATGKRPPRYDRLMADARVQAERYALALPDNHRTPPFLIVADIGRSFELYFDWSGNGRGYGFFPDQQNYRITIDQLEDEKVREVLQAIWTNPASVDPRLKAAEVTREIAKQLSTVAEHLEKEQRIANPGKGDGDMALGIESTSLFLMRTLFCMFAEDVELLPKGSFTAFLDESRDKSDIWWRRGLTDLWHQMSKADLPERFWSFGDAEVRYFNGNLFSSSQVYDLAKEFKGTLFTAAKQDWRSVEPAIFGTLLEQVLTPAERAKLGAHYTPRPYVQRLVSATFGELLNDEWACVEEAVRANAEKSSPHAGEQMQASVDNTAVIASEARQSRVKPRNTGLPRSARNDENKGKDLDPITLITAFLSRLTSLRILDPACGTGNFLYVSMEELLRLESKAIALAASLGEDIAPTVHPNQFLGLELNPRAAVIAELVLWIGWLRHRLANHPDAIGDPVLPTLSNINGGTHGGFDAVLRRTATGEPDIANPAVPDWPKADFIVGNPPFIGAKYLRENLGDHYVEALWKANPRVPQSADFVMQWWDHAAYILTTRGTVLKRFGFVTTNSITQTFSRRVIEGYLAKTNPSPPAGEGQTERSDVRERGTERVQASVDVASPAEPPSPAATKATLRNLASPSLAPVEPLGSVRGTDPSTPARGEGTNTLSLILAIADHPWTKATKDAAAVRIAMTVAQVGTHDGTVLDVVNEAALDTDDPAIATRANSGRINADLSLGTDLASVRPLIANSGLGSRGVQLIGSGFIITTAEADHLGLGTRDGLEKHVRPYLNGRDLLQNSRKLMVIDLLGLEEREVRQRFPEVYQHILLKVKPERDQNRRNSYQKLWWIHGEPRRELRPALSGLRRFIATPATSKHRIMSFISGDFLPDDAIIALAVNDAFHLGILTSCIHLEWTYANCGLIGVASFEQGHRYLNSRIFDPFPFPDATPEQRVVIAELAEELDATRKAALAEVPGLTMTEIYNLVAWLKSSPERGGGGEADGGVAICSSHHQKAEHNRTRPLHPLEGAPPRSGEDLDKADRATAARAGIIARLHEQIDAAVAQAYGWPTDLSPSEIVTRLVALNAERAAEESQGHIRWLRPDYQIPRFGTKAAGKKA